MSRRLLQHTLLVGCLGLVAALMTPSARASTFDVAPGWDLFLTEPGTSFMGVPLMGVPIGTFDFDNTFGRGLGVQNVGTTDTIVQRTTAAIPPMPMMGQMQTIPLLMQALQLETTAPINFMGNGLDNYFVTLESARGGPATTGTMTITWDGTGQAGTFSSFFDVFFDIRKGSLGGPIVFSSDAMLASGSGGTGNPWSIIPPVGALQINGVNRFLAGDSDPTQDFWSGTSSATMGRQEIPVTENAVGVSETHIVINDPAGTAVVPEPGTLTLACLGLAGLCGCAWRRRQQAA